LNDLTLMSGVSGGLARSGGFANRLITGFDAGVAGCPDAAGDLYGCPVKMRTRFSGSEQDRFDTVFPHPSIYR
jgi:hypothetical protein